MSAYLYDEALIDALKEVTKDSRITIVDPSQAFSYFAQYNKDKVVLPAIILTRSAVRLLDYRNQPLALKGDMARITDDNLIVRAQMIPMRIEWNIEVFAVDRRTCDEVIRELIYFVITKPRMVVHVPYDLDIDQNFDLLLNQDIVDNSDLVEFSSRGEYFREAISVYTENAFMFSSNKAYPTSLKVVTELDDSFINKE